MDKAEEIWKDIPGYEGLYQVSNLGRVKALQKAVYLGKYRARKVMPEKILSHHKTTTGYYQTHLYKNGHRKIIKTHRLVGLVFIDNPNNLPEINHKYGVTTDNRASELEWVTSSQNKLHSFSELGRINPKGEANTRSIGVEQFTLDGHLLKSFGSLNEAYRATGVHPTNIRKCLNGVYRQANGFVWKLKPVT